MIEYILSFLITLVIFSINLICYYCCTKEKVKFNIRGIIFLILSVAIISLLTIEEQYFLKILLLLLSTSISIGLLFREEILKSFFYALFIWLFLFASDTLFSLIMIINKISYYDIASSYLFRFLITFPVSLMQFILILIFKRILNNLYQKYYLKFSQNIIFIFLLSFFIMFMSFFAVLNASQSNVRFFSYLTIGSITVFSVLVMYIIKYIIKSYNLSILNKNIINENKLVREMSQKDAVQKHNLINNLLGVETVANKKAKALLDEIIISYKSEYEKINNINELPSGIQGLIYKKVYLKNIPDLNIIVENSFKDDIVEFMSPKSYNALTEAIGILLDNALEAVEKCNKKIIVIDTRKVDNNIYFEIKNTFDSIIDFDFLGKKNYTTKKDGHGIGVNH